MSFARGRARVSRRRRSAVSRTDECLVRNVMRRLEAVAPVERDLRRPHPAEVRARFLRGTWRPGALSFSTGRRQRCRLSRPQSQPPAECATTGHHVCHAVGRIAGGWIHARMPSRSQPQSISDATSCCSCSPNSLGTSGGAAAVAAAALLPAAPSTSAVCTSAIVAWGAAVVVGAQPQIGSQL